MKLDELHVLFLVSGLVLTLIAVSPALCLISLPKDEERISELWLLGPEQKAENYPFNVTANDEYNLYVGVDNQLDESAYYTVYVKLSNQTQQLPNSTTAEPNPLPPIYEFRFVLSDGKVWEAPLNFAMDYVLLQQNVTLNTISINGNTFSVNYISTWDSSRNGFYFQMVFELWLYNTTSNNFQYNNLSVCLVLNMTG